MGAAATSLPLLPSALLPPVCADPVCATCCRTGCADHTTRVMLAEGPCAACDCVNVVAGPPSFASPMGGAERWRKPTGVSRSALHAFMEQLASSVRMTVELEQREPVVTTVTLDCERYELLLISRGVVMRVLPLGDIERIFQEKTEKSAPGHENEGAAEVFRVVLAEDCAFVFTSGQRDADYFFRCLQPLAQLARERQPAREETRDRTEAPLLWEPQEALDAGHGGLSGLKNLVAVDGPTEGSEAIGPL